MKHQVDLCVHFFQKILVPFLRNYVCDFFLIYYWCIFPLARSERATERQKEKLDQEFPALHKENSPKVGNKDEEEVVGVGGVITLKQRELRESARSDSPGTPKPRIIGKKELG